MNRSIRKLMGKIRSFVIYRVMYYLRRNKLREFFEPDILNWSLVFDIGAHLGDKTRFFSQYEKLEVIAVEPHPYYFEKLQSQFINHKIKIINAGILGQPGKIRFFPSTSHPSVSTFNSTMIEEIRDDKRWRNVVWDDPLLVEIMTLKQLIETYGTPDFVKIDVEGSEDLVLSTIQHPLPFLSFEFLPSFKGPAKRSVAILEELGNYEYLFTVKENYVEGKWKSPSKIQDFMENYSGESGNIFARLQ